MRTLISGCIATALVLTALGSAAPAQARDRDYGYGYGYGYNDDGYREYRGEVVGRRGDKTAGAIIGAGVGALAGRAIDRSDGRRC